MGGNVVAAALPFSTSFQENADTVHMQGKLAKATELGHSCGSGSHNTAQEARSLQSFSCNESKAGGHPCKFQQQRKHLDVRDKNRFNCWYSEPRVGTTVTGKVTKTILSEL